jgi:hypothetical protein
MTGEIERALALAVGAIERVGIRYAIVGGLAVVAWTAPRATRDADLWVDLGNKRRELEQALRGAGFDVPAMEEELQRFGVFRSKEPSSGVFVDIFDATGELGEAILQNRREERLGDRSYAFCRAEELALLKAYSDRPRDFLDLVELVKLPLDIEYVRTWARKLDASIGADEVSQRLAQAMETTKRR